MKKEEKPANKLVNKSKMKVAENTWHPVIDYSRCRMCEFCLNFCFRKVFGKTGDGIIVENPASCVDKCHGCEWRCPYGAISFPEKMDREYADKVIKRILGRGDTIPDQFIRFVTDQGIYPKDSL